MLAALERPFTVEEQPLSVGERAGVVATRIAHEDGELVPAETSHEVARPRRPRERGRDLLQQQIAGRMPEGVVHVLEPIEVEEQERERGATRRAVVERALQIFGEQDAVRQLGEAVV